MVGLLYAALPCRITWLVALLGIMMRAYNETICKCASKTFGINRNAFSFFFVSTEIRLSVFHANLSTTWHRILFTKDNTLYLVRNVDDPLGGNLQRIMQIAYCFYIIYNKDKYIIKYIKKLREIIKFLF